MIAANVVLAGRTGRKMWQEPYYRLDWLEGEYSTSTKTVKTANGWFTTTACVRGTDEKLNGTAKFASMIDVHIPRLAPVKG